MLQIYDNILNFRYTKELCRVETHFRNKTNGGNIRESEQSKQYGYMNSSHYPLQSSLESLLKSRT